MHVFLDVLQVHGGRGTAMTVREVRYEGEAWERGTGATCWWCCYVEWHVLSL